jgi:hypothetical protein
LVDQHRPQSESPSGSSPGGYGSGNVSKHVVGV